MKTAALTAAVAGLVFAFAATDASAANPVPTVGLATAAPSPGHLGVTIDAALSAHSLGRRVAAARIADVVPNSPAEAAGLQVGDRLLKLDGTGVAGTSIRAFKSNVLSVAAGERRQLTVRRADGRIDTLDVVAAP